MRSQSEIMRLISRAKQLRMEFRLAGLDLSERVMLTMATTKMMQENPDMSAKAHRHFTQLLKELKQT